VAHGLFEGRREMWGKKEGDMRREWESITEKGGGWETDNRKDKKGEHEELRMGKW
jgi:hypothetical protein